MKATFATGLVISLTAAALAASTLAQSPRPADYVRGGHGADGVPRTYSEDANSLYRPGADATYYTTFGTDHTLKLPGAEESALNRQVETLVRQLESAESDGKRDEIKTKLTELLGKQFDARQKRHAQEIESLEARVKKLKQIVSQRQENRSDIIARKLDQIIQDSKGLGF